MTQELRDGEHEIGRGHAFLQRAGEMHADYVRREEVNRLAEHARLCLDSAHAPADDAQAVDHGGVGVGADERVGIPDAFLLQHAAGEILEVHLVNDADAGRHDLESVERLRSPFQKLVALGVALELDVHVELQRVGTIREVDLHGMVDDQVDGDERLDDPSVFARALRRGAHGREIDEQRDAGEVLQEDARDHERDLVGALAIAGPVRKGAYVLFT